MIRKAKYRISGVGCALVDYLYEPVDFSSSSFSRYLSIKSGDGGLLPGILVFKDEFEKFSGENYFKTRELITQGRSPVAMNIGGPCIVSLIHAGQMLEGVSAEVYFYGSKGKDKEAVFIDEGMKRTSLKVGNYKTSDQHTPFTDVLSDPGYDNGNGERIFINNIGAAWNFCPDDLDDAFFQSDMVVFGATALMPHIHESLLELLQKAKANKAVTVVTTVYDSLNEKKNPDKAWPLGESADTYRYVDLLIANMEEALRLSGQSTVEHAMDFFADAGAGAVVVTHGAKPTHYWSNSTMFHALRGVKPVSERVRKQLLDFPDRMGDTTGCGDNFAGGLIASVAQQLIEHPDCPVDLEEAVAWGTASGGYACFFHGGTFFEDYAGQKKALIEPYYQAYQTQINR